MTLAHLKTRPPIVPRFEPTGQVILHDSDSDSACSDMDCDAVPIWFLMVAYQLTHTNTHTHKTHKIIEK